MAGAEPGILALFSGGACAVAMVFLLVGFKLGRESAGLAMFGSEMDGDDAADGFAQADPWDAARSDCRDGSGGACAGACDFP